MPKGVYKRTEQNTKHLFKKGRKGKISSTSFKKRMTPWNKDKKGINIGEANPFFGKKHSKETLKKIKEIRKKQGSPWLIGKARPDITGERSFNWKGGITPINTKIRQSLEYKLWRTAVFERDNYTCIWCGLHTGNGKAVVLNADHIKPFAYYPELRFAIDNGRTLCIDCHKTTDTYGRPTKKI